MSSALARTEIQRALLPAGPEAVRRGRSVLRRLDLVRISDRILEAAGTMMPAELRSLDAIHLATVAALGADIRTVVTYDSRRSDAARLLGHRVAAPGTDDVPA